MTSQRTLCIDAPKLASTLTTSASSFRVYVWPQIINALDEKTKKN